MIDKEYMTIYTTASIRKFISASGFGVPVTFLQQGDEKDTPQQDEVQILIAMEFPDRGSSTELYGIVNIRALVKTKIVPTDVYYHTRVKARVIGTLDKTMPLMKLGGEDTTLFDKSQWGLLRRLQTETFRVTPTSLDVPDSSLVEAFFEIQSC